MMPQNTPQPRKPSAGIFGIGPIGKHRGFVADDHPLKQSDSEVLAEVRARRRIRPLS